MWQRLAKKRLKALWKQFPAVLILGARQVGKTTLAQKTFPQLAYQDLESPFIREKFTADPVFEIMRYAKTGLILDEAQYVPEVFAALRGIIDQFAARRGRFLILGSAQPQLIKHVSESLAGRVGILELNPLTMLETQQGERKISLQQLWLRGGFPGALRGSFREWWEAYLRTYIERDLPHLGIEANPLLLRRLLTMLAHAQGGLLNASSLGQSLGVSYHTIQRYLDILEQTFLLRRLPPYFRNVGKRLTKAPKIYLRDTGLVHHLLNINSVTELESHPVCGFSWETFVLEDLLRREQLIHPHTQFYFWRTAVGQEVDAVWDYGSHRIALEIKKGRGDHLKTLNTFTQAMQDIDAKRGWIIDQTKGREAPRPSIERRGIEQCIDWLPY